MLETPVVLIAFRRPEQTSEVIRAIRAARPKELFVVCDGPRSGNVDDDLLVNRVRALIDDVDWPCKVYKIYADYNLGLRERVLSGLDEVFELVDRAIILEDDCLPDQSFFSFSQSLLKRYEDAGKVSMVCGSNFAPYKSQYSYHFSSAAYIWGWATWSRVWKTFRSSPQVESWSEEDIKRASSFLSSKAQGASFATAMRKAKDLNTWDISFVAWLLQNEMKSIVPARNLVENIGFGEGATHTKFEAFDVQVPSMSIPEELSHPPQASIDSYRERRMWLSKSLRWFTFPILHPISFVSRFFSYFKTLMR